MKILILTSSLSIGGSSRVVCDLALKFKLGNHDVRIVSIRSNIANCYADLLSTFDIPCYLLGRKGKFDFSFIKKVRNAIKTFNPDVVSSHLSATYYYPFYDCKVPFFHTIHAKPTLDINRFGLILAGKAIKKGNIRLIGCSNSISQEAMDDFGVDVITAQNGIDMCSDDFALEKKYDFLFVGRLDKCKNLSLLIEAFSFLLPKMKNAKLCICGDGPERKHVLNLIEKLNISQSVDLITDCENPEPYYQSSKVFCLFSKREGGPIVLLEAIKYNLPLFCSNIAGNLNYAIPGKNADVFDFSQPELIAHAMLGLVNDKNKMERYSLFNAHNKKEFDINNTAKIYLNLFENYER